MTHRERVEQILRELQDLYFEVAEYCPRREHALEHLSTAMRLIGEEITPRCSHLADSDERDRGLSVEPCPKCGRFFVDDACSHPGAGGPCMPRVRDGRCIWCERAL
jgi:hypothetical protein